MTPVEFGFHTPTVGYLAWFWPVAPWVGVAVVAVSLLPVVGLFAWGALPLKRRDEEMVLSPFSVVAAVVAWVATSLWLWPAASCVVAVVLVLVVVVGSVVGVIAGAVHLTDKALRWTAARVDRIQARNEAERDNVMRDAGEVI